MKHLITLITLGALLAACGQTTSNLQGRRDLPSDPPYVPPVKKVEKIEWIKQDGGNLLVDFNPRVDILFVIDDSDSMKSAQENLISNLDSFVQKFNQNKVIDYHIGVVSVWDSTERFLKFNHPYQVGELHKVRNSKGQTSERRFVTRKDKVKEVLAPTLNIGVTPYNQGGPEKEEMFSPIEEALQKSKHGGANEGFFRDDAQLVVVILSDADDSTASIQPKQMAEKLFAFKGGNASKVSVYAALVKKSDPDVSKDWDLRIHPKYHPECFTMTASGKNQNNGTCQEGFGPDRLEQFVVASNPGHGTEDEVRKSYIMSLIQKSFGRDLANIGSEISRRTLAKEVFLDQMPRRDEKSGRLMIKVRYGTTDQLASNKAQVISEDKKSGWAYNENNNSIQLSGDIDYQFSETAHFEITMAPVNLSPN